MIYNALFCIKVRVLLCFRLFLYVILREFACNRYILEGEIMNSRIVNSGASAINFAQYDSLFFDLDGTLVDSSVAVSEVLQRWCNIRNLEPEWVFKHCHGARIIDFLPIVAPDLAIDEEVRLLAELEANITTGLVEISGAREFLEKITSNNIKWGIATACTSEIAKLRLITCGLSIPNVFVTSEAVSAGKPSPEVYQLAAQKMRVNPINCLAFEDSDLGITSALTAGCDVIAIGCSSSIKDPRIIAKVKDYRELLDDAQMKEAM